MSKSSEVIAGFFPAPAIPDSAWWEALWPQPGKVLADLGIEPEMTVIERCCGDGLFTVPLARMARRVIAIDLDPEMVRIAQTRVIASGAINCKFIAGDAYNIARLAPWLQSTSKRLHQILPHGNHAQEVGDQDRKRGEVDRGDRCDK